MRYCRPSESPACHDTTRRRRRRRFIRSVISQPALRALPDSDRKQKARGEQLGYSLRLTFAQNFPEYSRTAFSGLARR